MRHGDPLMVYRWPREAVIAAFAHGEAATLDHNEEVARIEREGRGPRKLATVSPPRRGLTLAHPQVKCESPEAARFWGLV